jgi:hypothetical protein
MEIKFLRVINFKFQTLPSSDELTLQDYIPTTKKISCLSIFYANHTILDQSIVFIL